MDNKEQRDELREAATDLVLRILERGRLNQREIMGEIGVRDGGINLAKLGYVEQILTLAKTEAIAFADKLIGQEVPVRTVQGDIMDEEPTTHVGDESVANFQRKQRIALANYQNPPAVTPTTELKAQTDATIKKQLDDDDIVRIDPLTSKTTDEPSRLVNDERSEAEA